MANRKDYRDRLKVKILGLEEEGYGDFYFKDSELDTYLELTVAGLFPALYRTVIDSGVDLTAYGKSGILNSVEVGYPDRVFMVTDPDEYTPLTGWSSRPPLIVGINTLHFGSTTPSKVNIHYYDAFTLPSNDTNDSGIASMYTPLIVLGALIEALEARHDVGLRPDQTQGHGEVSLIDRLSRRFETRKQELAMVLPAVVA